MFFKKDLKEQVLQAVTDSLRHHHQPPLRTGSQVLIGVSDFTLGCAWAEDNKHGQLHMVAAGLEASSPGRQIVLRESVVGIDNTTEAAIAQAVTVWQHGQFEVIQAAFANPPAAPDVQVAVHDEWTGQIIGWDVYESGVQVAGPDPDTLTQVLVDQPFPERFGAALADVLDPTALGPHWIKVYRGQSSPDTLSLTCSFDNDEWAEGAEILRALPWPSSLDYRAVRQFLILIPAAVAAAPTFRLTRDIPPTRVLLNVAQLIHDQPDAEEDALVQLLIGRGIPEQIAEKLLVFLPLAAGRRVVERFITPPAVFAVQDAAGAWIEYPLDGQPLYRAAQRLVSGNAGSRGLTKEVFETLVRRSVEVKLVNDALTQGIDISEGVLSPIHLGRLTAEDFGPPQAPLRI